MTQHVGHRGSDPGAVFARRGERVTSEDGTTTICTVRRDLFRHALVNVADFEDWAIPKPHSGDQLGRTPGFRTLPDGRPQVCIEGEWRPELGPEGG